MIPSMQIETGTISSTVMQYSRDLVGAWDSYVLFDCADAGQTEEYALIVADKYENGVFYAPCTVYHFENIQVSDSLGHNTMTYTCTPYTVNQNINFPSNNQHLIVYSSIDGYPKLERSVENYETLGFVLFGVAITVCIVHVVLQSVIRRFG